MVFHLMARQNLDFVPKGKTESDRVKGCKLYYDYDDTNSRHWEGKVVKDKFFRFDDPLYNKAKSVPVDSFFSFESEFDGSRSFVTDIILE